MARDAREFASDGRRRKHVVDTAGGGGASRHAVRLGGGHVLRERHAAVSLDFRHAQGAIGTGPGQDDPDGAIALFLREGTHEVVDGHVQSAGLLARPKVQSVIGNGHAGVGGNDVDVVDFRMHAIGHLFYLHGGFLGEQVGEEAVMLGVQMLDEDEGHSSVGW